MNDTVELSFINRVFEIFMDTKKALHYNKCTGMWGWGSRSSAEDDTIDTPFSTAWDAILDSVEPYLNEEDN